MMGGCPCLQVHVCACACGYMSCLLVCVRARVHARVRACARACAFGACVYRARALGACVHLRKFACACVHSCVFTRALVTCSHLSLLFGSMHPPHTRAAVSLSPHQQAAPNLQPQPNSAQTRPQPCCRRLAAAAAGGRPSSGSPTNFTHPNSALSTHAAWACHAGVGGNAWFRRCAVLGYALERSG